jgi:hypothetical protein
MRGISPVGAIDRAATIGAASANDVSIFLAVGLFFRDPPLFFCYPVNSL